MLTNNDIAKLKEVFATKEELNDLKSELKNDIVEFKDAILHEIVAMREELAVTLGHRDMLEDHETRITKLEKKSSKPN